MADVTSVNENVTGWYSEMFASGASRVLLFGELVGRSFVSLIRSLYLLSTRLSSPQGLPNPFSISLGDPTIIFALLHTCGQ